MQTAFIYTFLVTALIAALLTSSYREAHHGISAARAMVREGHLQRELQRLRQYHNETVDALNDEIEARERELDALTGKAPQASITRAFPVPGERL